MTQYAALIPRFYVLVNRAGNAMHILPLFLKEDSSEFYECPSDLESVRECGRMIIIGMAFGAIPDFVPFLGKSLETLVAKLLSMTNE